MLNGNEARKDSALARPPAHDLFVESYKKWRGGRAGSLIDVTLLARVHPGSLALSQLFVFRPEAFFDMAEAYRVLESPIEIAMFFALALVGLCRECDNVQYVHAGVSRGTKFGGSYLSIEPQATIGAYRVDFLVTLSESVPDFNHMNGEHPRSKVIESKIVVECDGFDFHERTKEQASKDRARDRVLQSRGYRVFRYIGTDIWRDVFSCAGEVATYLVDSNTKQREG